VADTAFVDLEIIYNHVAEAGYGIIVDTADIIALCLATAAAVMVTECCHHGWKLPNDILNRLLADAATLWLECYNQQ
jgi:hypothetical protein